MSPEQATSDQSMGPAADIWALGCVLYEMLVGEPLDTGTTPQAILGKIIVGETPSVAAKRSSVPANVDATIAKALEKVPADRFPTAARFSEALADWSFGSDMPDYGSHPSFPASRLTTRSTGSDSWSVANKRWTSLSYCWTGCFRSEASSA